MWLCSSRGFNIQQRYSYNIILPAYDALTPVGGPTEGATVVHQEDNAPPHQEGDFHQWLTAEFNRRGWRLELQAPQGPYTNVLDLQVIEPVTLHFNLTLHINLTSHPYQHLLPLRSPLLYPMYVAGLSLSCNVKATLASSADVQQHGSRLRSNLGRSAKRLERPKNKLDGCASICIGV